jgi:hypothetical protein
MARMRGLLPVAVLVVPFLLVSRAAGDPPAPAFAPPPASLEQLAQRVGELTDRVKFMVDEANRDPRERKIRVYLGYSAKDLQDVRRDVRAKELVEWMVDPALNLLARQSAKDAIVGGAQQRGDPDLSLDEKKGSTTVRAWFCLQYVVKHLTHDDPKSAKLTSDLLKELWRPGGIPDILAFDPADPKTHRPAKTAWTNFLKKR